MAKVQQQKHNPHAINFASDEDAWERASDDFKEHFHQVLMGLSSPPGAESHHHLPDEEEGDEEHEGQSAADRQREREE